MLWNPPITKWRPGFGHGDAFLTHFTGAIGPLGADVTGNR
jgi:hypothetical protein